MKGRVALEARELTFSYRGGPEVVRDWSAVFSTGEMVAITGPSGKGKSTLLYLLGLMLQPAQGSVLLDGVDVTGFRDFQKARLRAEKFGFVFQDAALDATRSVLANVMETDLYRFGQKIRTRERALEMLESLSVDLSAKRKPGQVSGGQAQRVAMCRALLNSPSILLADEPTGNLDPKSSKIVIGALRDHASSGGAVIIVTHSPEVTNSCDREIRL